jgi:hypothetical protein
LCCNARYTRQVIEMFLGEHLIGLRLLGIRLHRRRLVIGQFLAQELVFFQLGTVVRRPVQEIPNRLQRRMHSGLEGVRDIVCVRTSLRENPVVAASVGQGYERDTEQHQHEQ